MTMALEDRAFTVLGAAVAELVLTGGKQHENDCNNWKSEKETRNDKKKK